MSLLGVDRAIRAKLRGEPLDAKGRSIAKAGLLIPVLREGNNTRTEGTWNPVFTGTFRQVAVHRYKDAGKPWENVRPCVVYRRVGFEFDDSQTPFNKHRVKIGETGDDVSVLDRAGQVVASGKSHNVMRKLPNSYTHRYQFDIWAENDVERDLIMEALVNLFPARGHLDYQQLDGSTLTVDMVQEDISDTDELSAEFEEREECHSVLIYRVEAFLDTTLLDSEEKSIDDATLETVDTVASEDDGLTHHVRTSSFNTAPADE